MRVNIASVLLPDVPLTTTGVHAGTEVDEPTGVIEVAVGSAVEGSMGVVGGVVFGVGCMLAESVEVGTG